MWRGHLLRPCRFDADRAGLTNHVALTEQERFLELQLLQAGARHGFALLLEGGRLTLPLPAAGRGGVGAPLLPPRRMRRRGPCAVALFVLEERLSGIPVHVQGCRVSR